MDLSLIVGDFVKNHRSHAREELQHYSSQQSLVQAIRRATSSCREDGKRHSHQRRIPAPLLVEAERRLLAVASVMKRMQSFSQLHDLIEHHLKPISGIGELTVYDVAHRIGAYLNLAPEEVYLHAGTRVGARKLGLRGKKIQRDALPKEFRKLSPSEIEDCLCIYSDFLDRPGKYLSAARCLPGIDTATGCRPVIRTKPTPKIC